MPCNPAVGGTAKGQLVREIDALGGLMGRAIDATGIQFKVLNRSRGPAVWAPRAQADKARYGALGARRRSSASRAFGWIEATSARISIEGGRVAGVALEDGAPLPARAVVVTTGTFLNGLIHVGDDQSRRDGSTSRRASTLASSCAGLGFALGPAQDRHAAAAVGRIDRLRRAVVDGLFHVEHGDATPTPLSFLTREPLGERRGLLAAAHHRRGSRRRPAQHRPVAALQRADQGIGPRYCPSLEDKVMRFPDRDRHLLSPRAGRRSTWTKST